MLLICQVVGPEFHLRGDIVVETHQDLEVVVHLEVDDVADIRVEALDLRSRHHPEDLVQQVYAPVIEHAAALGDIDMPVMHVSVEAVQAALDRDRRRPGCPGSNTSLSPCGNPGQIFSDDVR